ncbi:sodium:proton antiporter [Roseiconus lacunae]|uniref:Sodium:proton antiporter n=1 Tax=Roseiconus lacunae TaxID=2605694 RepID=A0ABT7PLJ0_9BACT|nr:sodium:proton antiporter [Roseiconus lacunae]MCD0460882.1 cation:proton antiporter [Roseiconus lacunae]MDM4017362.1 sodium:proton antiporter [Roseiconus lacunae]WRQ48727.1 sodium:proton antiporter [Stieleria sp. HD01]
MDYFLVYLVCIPILAVTAQWIAWKLKLPSILLLLLFGLALGGVFRPDEVLAEVTGGDAEMAGPNLLFPLVSLAVGVIMFEGGLSLKFSELKESGVPALRLCTVGALITVIGVAITAHYCLGFHWRMSFLVGAILMVTGPTVIGPLIKQVRPSNRVANTLKWEGIVIDPIGAVTSVLVFEALLIDAGNGTGHIAYMLAKTAIVGIVAGIIGGFFVTELIRRFLLPDNLHGVGALAVALLLFGLSDYVAHESGLITVTVMGVWMTNRHPMDIEHIVQLQEHLVTLLIGCLFIVLGSRMELAGILDQGLWGPLFTLILIVAVRPLSVFVALLGSKLNFKEQCFIAGLAPRGIVAAAISTVFALQLQRQGSAELASSASQLSNVIFMTIIGTVAIYGLGATPLANWLGLADKDSSGVLIVGADPWVREFALELKDANVPVVIVDTNFAKVSLAKMAGLNAHCVNIANEHARDALPLGGIGQMMAMTSNNEVNTFAVRECRSLFGRANVYQLTFDEKAGRTIDKSLTGRGLFAKGLKFQELERRFKDGWELKTTRLSDEFGFEDFVAQRKQVELLCIIDEQKQLKLDTVDEPVEPQSKCSVIALVENGEGSSQT